MLSVGERVRYVGSQSGNGYPYRGEIGRVVQTSGKMVKVTLKDGVNVNLSEENFKSAPAAVPLIGYSILAAVVLGITWKAFR